MGFYDGKGYWRNDGDGFYDSEGYWRNPGDGFYDGKGYWRNSGDGFYDSKGYWRNSGDGYYDGNEEWRNSDGSSGGCYITTACVEYKGLDDNCHELTILREYRDKLMKDSAEIRLQVQEYYENAPLIVRKIDAEQGRNAILEELYEDMVRPCVSLLDSGRIDEAKNVYLSSFENLKDKYLK